MVPRAASGTSSGSEELAVSTGVDELLTTTRFSATQASAQERGRTIARGTGVAANANAAPVAGWSIAPAKNR